MPPPIFQPKSYGSVPMPQPQIESPLRPLADLASLAGASQRLQAGQIELDKEKKAEASRLAVEKALTEAGGDFPRAVSSLEGQGRWMEASGLREKVADVQKAQQQALEAGLKRTREGFELGTRLLQGVEAADTPEGKSEAFASIRPQLTAALPEALHPYIPQRYEDDPTFVTRAIPFGLSVSDITKRREDAVTKLNEGFKKSGDQLERDKHVLDALGPWIDTAQTGEEIGQALDTAEKVYGASPAIRQRIGEVPPGPIAPDARAALAAKIKEPKLPTSIEGAILDARRRNDPKAVQSLIKLAGQLSDAKRADVVAADPESVSAVVNNPAIWGDITPGLRDKLLVPLAKAGFDFGTAAKALSAPQKAQIERWRTDQISQLDREMRDPQKLMTAADYETEKKRIEESYAVQMRGSGPAMKIPPVVTTTLRGQKPGKYTLSDGSTWVVGKDGSITGGN